MLLSLLAIGLVKGRQEYAYLSPNHLYIFLYRCLAAHTILQAISEDRAPRKCQYYGIMFCNRTEILRADTSPSGVLEQEGLLAETTTCFLEGGTDGDIRLNFHLGKFLVSG